MILGTNSQFQRALKLVSIKSRLSRKSGDEAGLLDVLHRLAQLFIRKQRVAMEVDLLDLDFWAFVDDEGEES